MGAEVFELVGPWMSVGVSQAIASGVWRPAAQYFNELLGYVQGRKNEDPNRQWYITGHFLGGGLAKLVGAMVGIEAVTFRAPGLERTLYLSLDQGSENAPTIIKTLRHQAVTVQPRNDLVFSVDSQVGVVIPMECQGPAHVPQDLQRFDLRLVRQVRLHAHGVCAALVAAVRPGREPHPLDREGCTGRMGALRPSTWRSRPTSSAWPAVGWGGGLYANPSGPLYVGKGWL